MGDPRLVRWLTRVAIAMTLGFLALALYEKFGQSRPGELAYHEANTLFEDGAYARAAERYRDALAERPDFVHARRGLARSLHQAGRHEEALAVYGEAIAMAPEFGGTYANRGILLDTLGRHEDALADYKKAIELMPEVAEGPGWFTRFVRNQAEAPPTVADRAAYLEEQLALPESERTLRQPELDERQRSYRQ